jgi:hypothetical protein
MAALVSIPPKKANASGTKSCATQNRKVMTMISMNGLAKASLFWASLSLEGGKLWTKIGSTAIYLFFSNIALPHPSR